MTVDSTGQPPGVTARPLPAYWPDLAFGAVVFVFGLIEALARYAVTGPALAVIGCLAVAAGFFRLRPGLALALVWVAALSLLAGGARPMFPLLSVLAVSFGVARWGRPLTVWLGGLSIPAVGVVAAWWSTGYGIPSPPLVLDALRVGYWPGVPVAQMFAWALTVLVPLGLPFIVGLALRSTASSRASQVAAEESRDLAEAQRDEAEHAQQQAQEIARLRQGQAQLARDVHDVVGHSLAVILAQAEAARTLPETDVAGMREAMGNVADSARQSLRDVRQVLSTTRSPGSGEPRRGGLVELVEGIAAAGNDVRSVVLGDPVPLPPELDQVAYRVLQEMLTNALKHGRAGGPVWVEQAWGEAWQPEELRLEVANIVRTPVPTAALDMTQPIRPGETPPAEPVADPPTGLGLVSMRQRLASVGGRLDVRRRPSADGDIFTATAWLPLHAAEVR